METNRESTEITAEKVRGVPFKKGDDPRRNLEGRPSETLNFKTKWLLFIDKIAEQNNITADEVDKQMLTVAYKQMQSGDYRYWKDIQDRVYGTAVMNQDIMSGGEKIQFAIINYNEDNNNSIPVQSEELSAGDAQSPTEVQDFSAS